jgi:hypothetical protein
MNNKETIGLAGEYAVAFELCRRGFYAQLTLGNHKKTDILVETSRSLFRVSVKAKTGDQWPKVSGIWAEGDLLVFVDFKNKDMDKLPDFYVLDVSAWKTVVKRIVKDRTDGAKINNENTVYWEPWDGHPKGWVGCAINVSQIERYKDCWPKP